MKKVLFFLLLVATIFSGCDNSPTNSYFVESTQNGIAKMRNDNNVVMYQYRSPGYYDKYSFSQTQLRNLYEYGEITEMNHACLPTNLFFLKLQHVSEISRYFFDGSDLRRESISATKHETHDGVILSVIFLLLPLLAFIFIFLKKNKSFSELTLFCGVFILSYILTLCAWKFVGDRLGALSMLLGIFAISVVGKKVCETYFGVLLALSTLVFVPFFAPLFRGEYFVANNNLIVLWHHLFLMVSYCFLMMFIKLLLKLKTTLFKRS